MQEPWRHSSMIGEAGVLDVLLKIPEINTSKRDIISEEVWRKKEWG